MSTKTARNGAKTDADKKPTFKTSIDIPKEARAKVIDILNLQLANVTDLALQTKQAHWNVKGPNFFQLHELFDDLYAKVWAHVDVIAERVTTLGGYATGTVRMTAGNSALEEYPTDAVEGSEHLTALIERYAVVAKAARAGIDSTDELGDADAADILTAVSRDLDQSLWFLEAHVQS